MKTIFFIPKYSILLVITVCFSIYSQDEYSGVYKGIIDFGACCGVYEQGEGWIAFDFSENPPTVLYDGVFFNAVSLTGKNLVDDGEYSAYPRKIIGVFGQNGTQKGFWYNYRDEEGSGSWGKVFLTKEGESSQAVELIETYRNENKRFELFFADLRSYIKQNDLNSITALAYSFPFEENSCVSSSKKLSSNVRDQKELGGRIKSILSVMDPDYEIHYFRFEDHHPFGGSKYEVYCGAQFQFMEIGGQFKLVAILCYG